MFQELSGVHWKPFERFSENGNLLNKIYRKIAFPKICSSSSTFNFLLFLFITEKNFILSEIENIFSISRHYREEDLRRENICYCHHTSPRWPPQSFAEYISNLSLSLLVLSLFMSTLMVWFALLFLLLFLFYTISPLVVSI